MSTQKSTASFVVHATTTGYRLAEVDGRDAFGPKTNARTLANALMAAAGPDLLNCLEAIEPILTDDGYDCADRVANMLLCLPAFRAAIAKAKGNCHD
jgi:hypothetical protein